MNHKQHTMQVTSLLNYFPSYSEQAFNDKFRQDVKREIVKLLQTKINLTDREMTRLLEFKDPNKVRPRRHELVKTGFLIEDTKRPCEVTEKLCIAWKLDANKLCRYMEGF